MSSPTNGERYDVPIGHGKSKTGGSAEADFLLRYDPRLYDQFAVAVDVVLISTHAKSLRTLLVRRDDFPFKGSFALPGGFVQTQEDLASAAARVCKTKVGVDGIYLEQLYTFGTVDRDPRMRIISVAYYTLIEERRFMTMAARGPSTVAMVHVPWKGDEGGPVTVQEENGRLLPMAFDHDRILGLTVKRLRGKIGYTPLALALLGEEFTLLELQRVHEAILGRALNKDSFRRKILATGWIRGTGKLQSEVVHRPAELYTATPETRPILGGLRL